MTTRIDRRTFLSTAAMSTVAGALGLSLARPALAGAPRAEVLTIGTRVLDVKGRAATVFAIRDAAGKHGLSLTPGARFRVDLENRSGVPTLIHWHGQTPPNDQDGVPGPDRPPLAPGERASYDFAPRPGTHWMHSHHDLFEQQLMAAPLVVHAANPQTREIVLMLHDFTFRDPAEILGELMGGGGGHAGHAGHTGHGGHSGHAGHAGHSAHAAHGAGASVHFNDIEYDAFLANDRTLDDPEVIRVEKGELIRLRIINAAAATNFHLDVGGLGARLIAVDGADVTPLSVTRVPLATAQRADLMLTVPKDGGVFPVLALREGAVERTGIVLATQGARIARLADRAAKPSGALDLSLEAKLVAQTTLPRRSADRRLELALGEGPGAYDWTLGGKTFAEASPLQVRRGERVELTFVNPTGMSHPMHLHGHHFQVVAIGNRRISGALRDTVLVPAAGGRVTIAFDADNPGDWMLHCHNLYHQAAGMMTVLRYEA